MRKFSIAALLLSISGLIGCVPSSNSVYSETVIIEDDAGVIVVEESVYVDDGYVEEVIVEEVIIEEY